MTIDGIAGNGILTRVALHRVQALGIDAVVVFLAPAILCRAFSFIER